MIGFHNPADGITYKYENVYWCCVYYQRFSEDRVALQNGWAWSVLVDVCDPPDFRWTQQIWPYAYPRSIEDFSPLPYVRAGPQRPSRM